MAEVLVLMKEVDKEKENESCVKGDIIDIRPDGFKWGTEEIGVNFLIVKVEGKTVAELDKYKGSLQTEDGAIIKVSKWSYDEVDQTFNNKDNKVKVKHKDL